MQRLVVFNSAQQFCAEPSPDGLAAFAASLSGGISGLSKERAASIAAAIQGSSGSIGLRTQSITLMRDALYRICEGSMSGHINGSQYAMLLSRSQDLTAIVLAVEQLTGAVAAPALSLSGYSSADATAALLTSDELVARAKKAESEATASYEKAKASRQEAEAQLVKDEVALTTAQAAHDSASESEKPALLEKRNLAEAQRDATNIRLEEAVEAEALAEERKKNAQESAVAAEQARDSALVSVSSVAKGSATFLPINAGRELDTEAVKSVSEAVVSMVTSVLNKPYLMEACLAHLSGDAPLGAVAARDSVGAEKLAVEKGQKDLTVTCLEFLQATIGRRSAEENWEMTRLRNNPPPSG